MANLLEEASILLTPTAYNDGSMLSVKPENGDGDFTFSRNSAATRVNAQGLVENVQILSSNLVLNGDFSEEGSEEVLNGDFANGSTDWNLRDAWVVSNGICSLNPPNSDYLSQANVLTSNKSYKLTFDIIVNSGNLQPQFFDGGFQTIGTYSTTQTVEVYFESTSSGTLYFKPNSFTGSITNISVKEVGQSWAKAANWSIADGKATSTGAGRMFQSIPFLETNVGTKVVVSFDIVDYTSGGVVIQCYGASSENFTGVGTHTFTTVTTNTLNFYINNSGQGNLVGSIDNVSVKEITDETNLPRINYEDGCGSWLLEPQSTNSITHSEDFSSTLYVKDGGVIVGNTNNISPSGEVNATEINVTDNGRIYADMSSATYYSTVFIKAGTFSYFKFLSSNIDLVAETNSNGSIENYGNGWFRIGVAITSVRPFQIQAYPDNTYTAHTTAGSYYIWGAQAEQQSFATSYIPTQGAASTRLKDIANNSGNASYFNDSEGVLYAEISRTLNGGSYSLISVSSNSTQSIVSVGKGYNTNKLFIYVKFGGVTVFSDTTIDFKDSFQKIAIKYKSGESSVFIDGSKMLTSSSIFTTVVPLEVLRFSWQSDTSNPFYGKTKALAVFKTALTDEQLTALTTI